MSRRVTLTFDNGPTPGVTEGVLQTLQQHGAPATFFVVGRELERDGVRALAERAVAEGHRVGNHTLTHTVLLGACDDPALPEREIGGAQRLLGELAGSERLFRPFGGGGILGPQLLGPHAVDYLEAGGFTCVLWNSVPRDWEDPDGWVEACLADVAEKDWTVAVLHDTPTGAMRHLPRFLDELDRAGATFCRDFPDSCVPIRRGVRTAPLDHLMPPTFEECA